MASKGQKFMKVPLEKKLKVMKERLTEGKSFPYLGKKYDINPETIRTWIRIFQRDGGLEIRKKGRRKEGGAVDYKERYEILKKFLDFLEEADREKK